MPVNFFSRWQRSTLILEKKFTLFDSSLRKNRRENTSSFFKFHTISKFFLLEEIGLISNWVWRVFCYPFFYVEFLIFGIFISAVGGEQLIPVFQYWYTISFLKFKFEIRCQKLLIDTENNRYFEIQRWKRFVVELCCLHTHKYCGK